MLKVFQEGHLVVIDLCGRRRDVLLTPSGAEALAAALEEKALLAEKEPKGLFRGERWNLYVDVYDRQVAMRFTPPDLGMPDRCPLTVAAARATASLLRTSANFAGYGLKIEVG